MKESRGVGLVDVANAILILALIASFFVPVYQAKQGKTKYEASVMMLDEVSDALEKHYLETGVFPVFENWSQLAKPGNALEEEGYIDSVPAEDAFGRPFIGKSDGASYKIEGQSITSYNEKLVKKYPDYWFNTGGKFKQKGKQDR